MQPEVKSIVSIDKFYVFYVTLKAAKFAEI